MTDLGKPALDGVKALLNAAMPATTVYTAGVTDADDDLTYPYLVIWPTSPARSIANLCGNLRPARMDFRVIGCGRDPDEAITVLERAGDAVVGERLVVEGWDPGFLRELTEGQPVGENTEILFNGRPTFRGWTIWRFSAEPAKVSGS